MDTFRKFKPHLALGGVLGGALLARLLLALQDLKTLLALSIPDDAFYYFKIAENIASGRGSTFDGLHPTNGYHPLWLGLMTPISFVMAGRADLAVTLVLVGQALLDVLTAYWVYLLARAILVDRGWAILACALYALNPHTVLYQVNGMETALTTLLQVMALYLFLPLERLSAETSTAQVRFAVACGLLMLARTDHVFLCLVLFGALAVREWKQHASVRRTVRMTLVAAALLAPWLIWNYTRFHQWVQVSGLARPLVMRHKLRTSWMEAGLTLLGHELTDHWPKLSCLLGGYFVLLAVGWLLLRRSGTRPEVAEHGADVLSLAWLGLFMTVAFHCFARLYVRPWYSAPFLVLHALTAAWAGRRIARQWSASRGVALVMGVIFAAYIVMGVSTVWKKVYPWQVELARAAEWTNLHTNPSARIGAFNAGIVSFFSRRTVVNLDGVVNNSAYDALRARRLHDYLVANSIDYLADFQYSVEVDYADFWGDSRLGAAFVPVADFPAGGAEWEGSFVQVYKVTPLPNVPLAKTARTFCLAGTPPAENRRKVHIKGCQNSLKEE